MVDPVKIVFTSSLTMQWFGCCFSHCMHTCRISQNFVCCS